MTTSIWQWQSEAKKWREIESLHNCMNGLLYGYGVYTSFSWSLKRTLWDQHFKRLLHDAAAMGLAFGTDGPTDLYEQLQVLLAEQLCRLRLTLLPDVPHFQNIASEPLIKSQLLLTRQPLAQQTLIRKTMQLLPVVRSNAGVKHMQIADVLLEKRNAFQKSSGQVNDVLFSTELNGNIYITEASTANLIAVNLKRQILLSPEPAMWPCLPGITARHLLEQASSQGWQTGWGDMTLDSLAHFDTLLLSNAVSGLTPVEKILAVDGQCILWRNTMPEAQEAELIAQFTDWIS